MCKIYRGYYQFSLVKLKLVKVVNGSWMVSRKDPLFYSSIKIDVDIYIYYITCIKEKKITFLLRTVHSDLNLSV